MKYRTEPYLVSVRSHKVIFGEPSITCGNSEKMTDYTKTV